MSLSKFSSYPSKFILLLAVISGLLVSLTACKEESKLLPKRSLDHPLVFIGLDGAEWSVMEPLLAKGELPNFRKLMDRGIHAGIINPGAMISPPIWTTYITGEHPRLHGILDHTFPYSNVAAKQPVNSTLRVKPALWNIASDAGLRSAVMGYFVSWPAEDINGTIVSDRASQGFADSVFPKSREGEVRSIADEVLSKSGRRAFLKRFYPWGYRIKQLNDPDGPYYDAARLIVSRADRPLLNDEVIRRNTLALQANAYDFVVVYLRSADLTSHSFWREYDDSDFAEPADPKLKKLLGNVIPEAYRYLDEAVGSIVEKFGPDANYILVSDHGFHSAGKELVLNNKFKSVLTGNHLPVGVFMAAGPDIGRQEQLPPGWRLTVLDIMPTLVRFLDLPLAKNLTGEVLTDLFKPEFLTSHKLVKLAEYPLDGFARPYNSAVKVKQTEEMKSLTGLGYVGGGTEVGLSNLQQYNFWDASDTLIAEHTSGEIIDALLHAKKRQASQVLLAFMQHKAELEPMLMARIRTRMAAISASKYLLTPVDGLEIFKKFRRSFIRNNPGVLAGNKAKAKAASTD